MFQTFGVASLLMVFLALSSDARAEGPSREQLAAALVEQPEPPSASRLKSVRCTDFGPDEPTEFNCTYQQIDRRGVWKRLSVIVAIDGDRWILLDGPSPTSRSRGR
jgi:hypothetical protein